MRIAIMILTTFTLTSTAVADGAWRMYERATPATSWAPLNFNHLPTEKWAFDSAESRCLASRSKALKPKAQLKIVAPDGAEHILVCSEVRAANGTPDRETVVKEGQIKLW